MKDRFKFRAYWKDTKKEILDFMEEYSLTHLDDEDIEVVQCTGLKDKNGKLIYEGDIIKARWENYDNIYGDDNYKYEGEYKGSVFYKEAGYCLNQPDSDYTPSLNNCCLVDKWEIIGNIYKNPELTNPNNKESK